MTNSKKIRGLEKDLEGIMQELEEVLIFEIERMFDLGIAPRMTSAPYAYINCICIEGEDALVVWCGLEYTTLENAALSDLQLLYHLGKTQENEQGKK